MAPVSRGKDRRTRVGLVMRLSKDLWLLDLAFKIAERSTCTREKHGCVIARNGIVVATGYNGSPEGDPHCDEVGCDLAYFIPVKDVQDASITFEDGSNLPFGMIPGKASKHCVRTIHSEINAIINAALVGSPIDNCDWYITGVPCSSCMGAILRTGPQSAYFCSDRGGVDPAGREERIDRFSDGRHGTICWCWTMEELRKEGVQV